MICEIILEDMRTCGLILVMAAFVSCSLTIMYRVVKRLIDDTQNIYANNKQTMHSHFFHKHK
mgnify:CR=1 FL=1